MLHSPPWASPVSQNPPANAGDVGSIPGLRRPPGEGHGVPTPVLLPGKSHGQRSLAGCSPWGRKRLGHDLATKQQQQQHSPSYIVVVNFIFCCFFAPGK